MPEELYLGLMSGTSVDGIDTALLHIHDDKLTLQAKHEYPMPVNLAAEVGRICSSGEDEIERLGVLDRQLGLAFGQAALQLLADNDVKPGEVKAIGSHGQTIRHRPASGGHDKPNAFTLQIGDPNTIAEYTGIDTVDDFRRRDIAAGGEGAPLAPAFHRAAFAESGRNRAIINIGGIANITVLAGAELIAGFDTGPGNTLLDQWHRRHQGGSYDRNGAWSAENNHSEALLQQLLSHPYFDTIDGPRSTGREAFNLEWLETLQALGHTSPQVVQSTLAELTATSIARAVAASAAPINEVYVCGGGAYNTDLMRRLYRHLGDASLDTTAALGIPPDWVEAAAFAWLAMRRIHAAPGNAPVVTGASGERVLGTIFTG
ncbi:MAG: anhydro-N-acetylmuramic acid kinase [Pseudomonadota bacterium]